MSRLTLGLLLVLTMTTCVAYSSPHYRITDLGVAGGGQASTATALNDRGQVVGYLESPRWRSPTRHLGRRAFVWSEGRMSVLPVLGSQRTGGKEDMDSVAAGINNRGRIVGTLTDFFDGAWMGADWIAVIWDGPRLTPIPCLPYQIQNTAIGINDDGTIVGTADNDFFQVDKIKVPHLFSYHDGVLSDLGPGNASGVNASGEISGYLFLRGDGTPASTTVNTQEITDVQAFRIDRTGQRHPLGKGWALGIDSQGAVWGLLAPPVNPFSAPQTREEIAFAEGRSTRPKFIQRGNVGYGTEETVRLDNTPRVLWTPSPHTLPIRWTPTGRLSDGLMVGGHWLWQGGKTHDLRHLIPGRSGWTSLDALAINRRGQIAGWGTHRGRRRAFLMTPVDSR